jgi:hypothetical protein
VHVCHFRRTVHERRKALDVLLFLRDITLLLQHLQRGALHGKQRAAALPTLLHVLELPKSQSLRA